AAYEGDGAVAEFLVGRAVACNIVFGESESPRRASPGRVFDREYAAAVHAVSVGVFRDGFTARVLNDPHKRRAVIELQFFDHARFASPCGLRFSGAPGPRNRERRRSTSSSCFNSHSQTTQTFHPSFVSASVAAASRAQLREILEVQ